MSAIPNFTSRKDLLRQEIQEAKSEPDLEIRAQKYSSILESAKNFPKIQKIVREEMERMVKESEFTRVYELHSGTPREIIEEVQRRLQMAQISGNAARANLLNIILGQMS